MFLIKAKKSNVTQEVYKDIVDSYLSYVSEKKGNLSGYHIVELLRYSLCKYMGLETKGSSENVEKYSDECINHLKPVFNKHSILDKSVDYKKGILEACIHCIEMSRKRAGV